MTVIGSARHDERAQLVNGQAGDQTGREVCTQAYYNHSQGWTCLRADDDAVANKLAYAMLRACRNDHIGYDQNQRDTLRVQAAKVGYDPGSVAADCECDCSALVRVCLLYAGIPVGDFSTAGERAAVLATGAFSEASFDAASGAGLQVGDILVTRTKGHTVIVVDAQGRVTVPDRGVRYCGIAGGRILPEMHGRVDSGGSADTFAGITGEPLEYIGVDGFDIRVATEASKGKWLPWVKRYDMDDLDKGCAGDGSGILKVQVKGDVYYQTACIGKGFYSVMHGLEDTGGSGDDFAGDGKNVIDRIRIY